MSEFFLARIFLYSVQEKLQSGACNFIKNKRPWHRVFSCEFCEISKNTFFHRTPLVAASASGFIQDLTLIQVQKKFWSGTCGKIPNFFVVVKKNLALH